MEERYLDLVLVPLGLLLQAAYNIFLFYTVKNHPDRTVIGLDNMVKQHWVRTMMQAPVTNGVLALQTVRNSIMASTVLATTAISLATAVSAFVRASSSSSASFSPFVYGNTSATAYSVKYLSISFCFFTAFLLLVQSIRYYSHAGFLLTHAATAAELEVEPSYVAWGLNRGTLFWSMGLRAFYLSSTLFLWLFGPIPMLASSVAICAALYFLDSTSAFTRKYHQSIIVKHSSLITPHSDASPIAV